MGGDQRASSCGCEPIVQLTARRDVAVRALVRKVSLIISLGIERRQGSGATVSKYLNAELW